MPFAPTLWRNKMARSGEIGRAEEQKVQDVASEALLD